MFTYMQILSHLNSQSPYHPSPPLKHVSRENCPENNILSTMSPNTYLLKYHECLAQCFIHTKNVINIFGITMTFIFTISKWFSWIVSILVWKENGKSSGNKCKEGIQ